MNLWIRSKTRAEYYISLVTICYYILISYILLYFTTCLLSCFFHLVHYTLIRLALYCNYTFIASLYFTALHSVVNSVAHMRSIQTMQPVVEFQPQCKPTHSPHVLPIVFTGHTHCPVTALQTLLSPEQLHAKIRHKSK